MNEVISDETHPIKMWLDLADLEVGAEQQFRNLANLPFLYKHVVCLSDAHQGFGMPIGGVIATKGVVMPNAVGSDISCGVCFVKTSIREVCTEEINKITDGIRVKIPVGSDHHQESQGEFNMPTGLRTLPGGVVEREFNRALKSLGTLGSGNHFLELQKSDDGYLCFMIHSGSRNLGFRVAKYYNVLAVKRNAQWCSSVPKSWQLAHLPFTSQEGKDYWNEMIYCMEYARLNRELMMKRVQESISDVFTDVVFSDAININHNYAAMENHFGENVVVHRKGATRARKGEWGIIPGSQGTSSYVVKGKGNSNSFMSCSHGAGRTMSRTKARNELDLKAEIKKLDDAGVIHGLKSQQDLEEAVGAYKDIDKVIAYQEDLIEVVHKLKPLAVIKG